MATVTIRNLDEKVVTELKIQAKSHNRSLEAELREMLSKHAEELQKRRDFIAFADRVAAMTPDVPQTDGALLVREDRDR